MKDNKIQYNMAVEYLFSLMRTFDQQDIFENGKVLIYRNREIDKYCLEIRNSMDPKAKRFLRKFVNGFTVGLLAIIAYALRQKIERPQELIDFLSQATPKDITNMILRGFNITKVTEDSTLEEIREAISDMVDVQFDFNKGNHGILESFMVDPSFKKELVIYLKLYYKEFFSPIEEEIEQKLKDIVERHEKIKGEDEERFIRHFLPLIMSESQEVRSLTDIYVSYFDEISNIFLCYSGDLDKTYIYGSSLEQKMDPSYINLIRKEFFNLLQDDTRYKIMRLLATKKWYGKELADHFGLTTATVSYHLNRLNKFGVVEIEKGIHKRYYYSLNKVVLTELYMRVLDDLLEGK